MANPPITVWGSRWRERIEAATTYVEDMQLNGTPGRRRRSVGSDGGGCDRQNAMFHVYILGKPTGGELVLTFIINGVSADTTFNWDDDATEVKAALVAAHSEIDTSDVTVTGGPFPNTTMIIEFKGALTGKDIAIPAATWTNIAGGLGVGVVVALAQKGHS